MADADVSSHVCGGRICRVQCGDCGLFVEAELVREHVCSFEHAPVFARRCLPITSRAPVLRARSRRRAPPPRRTAPPFVLRDVHERVELLCVELEEAGVPPAAEIRRDEDESKRDECEIRRGEDELG